jgi:hypothetical protein
VFALGMYLPLELNLPALVGGFLAHYIGKRSEAAGGAAGSRMRERAVIVASGFMAGGALGGVIGAALRLFGWYSEDLIRTPFFAIDWLSQTISTLAFVGLCWYMWREAIKKEGIREQATGDRARTGIRE